MRFCSSEIALATSGTSGAGVSISRPTKNMAPTSRGSPAFVVNLTFVPNFRSSNAPSKS